ncbi:unnamed protein product, partial [Clonostachys byssicola]
MNNSTESTIDNSDTWPDWRLLSSQLDGVSPTEAFTCRLRVQHSANQSSQPERCRLCAIIWFCVNRGEYRSITRLNEPVRACLAAREHELARKLASFIDHNRRSFPGDGGRRAGLERILARRLDLPTLRRMPAYPSDFAEAYD